MALILKIDALALYFFGQNIKIYIDNDSPSQGYAKLSSLQTFKIHSMSYD